MIDRALCKQALHERYAPRWPCPTCGRGTLQLVRDSVRIYETRASRLARNRDGWFEDDISEKFVAALVCDQQACREPVAVAGATYHEPIDDGEGGQVWTRRLKPLYIDPPLPLISLPAACPADIASEINAALSLYWFDASSAANRVRAALERILTFLKVSRYQGRGHDRRRLNLHRRIELFRAKRPELGDPMLAVKWIGNEGSHPGSVSRDDLLDAFQLLEHLLDEIFINRRAQISKISRTVLGLKGPRSKAHVLKRRKTI